MQTTTTAAGRLLADYGVTEPSAVAAELQDSGAALLSWAGRDGRYGLSDLEAILQGHGETLRAWLDECERRGLADISRADDVLGWLGY